MAAVNQEFQSGPMGGRCIRAMVLGFGIIGAFVIVNTFAATKWKGSRVTTESRMIVAMAPLAGLVIMLPIYYLERSKVSRFAIAENCLMLGKKSFPLAGLVSVERDPKIMCWAFKKGYGNDGLGAIRGRFWSKRVGKFEAFLTGTDNAVVLRWPDRVVAVSPADPEFFITCARSASGLR